jgi:hypothetical protein
MSGGSFSGGSFTGGSFSGGGFSGGSMMGMGGSMMGSGGSGRSISGGSTMFTGIAQTNRFRDFYKNPTAMGLLQPGMSSTNNAMIQFGMPSYGTQPLVQNMSTSLSSSMSGSAGSFAPAGNTSGLKVFAVSANSRPVSPNASVVATSGRLHSEVQAVLARSTALSSKGSIQVGVDGRTVVLRGTVSDERERRSAENMLRLTPGVADVRNELTIGPAPPRPRP